jgi:hypothetical protein
MEDGGVRIGGDEIEYRAGIGGAGFGCCAVAMQALGEGPGPHGAEFAQL